MPKRWVIRIILYDLDSDLFLPSLWLNQLEHAGLIHLHWENDSGEYCFYFLPPKEVKDTKKWSEQESDYIRNSDINAVSIDSNITTQYRGGSSAG